MFGCRNALRGGVRRAISRSRDADPCPHPRGRAPRRRSNGCLGRLCDDDAITVGSFNFAESELLAEIYSQALEGGGFRVRRAFDLGPREFVAPALAGGLSSSSPSTPGTALASSALGTASGRSRTTRPPHERLVRALTGRHVTALAPAPAQDANTFVVTARRRP